MDSLFVQEVFRDFGPVALAQGRPVPALTRVDARTVAMLKKQVLQLAPRRPGVYGMLDSHGVLHYIGKARNLRTRLLSYFRARSRPAKATRIIRSSRSVVWETWPREFSTLLRELELIRRWRPRWNVVGQPLPRRHGMLCLGRFPAPHLFLTRHAPANVQAAFGPVPMGERSLSAVRLLNDVFQLRDCPTPVEITFPEQGELFDNPRPVGCLRFELGACLAPCTGTCAQEAYAAQARRAQCLLEQGDDGVLAGLRRSMQAAAAQQRYELAAALRDRCELLAWFLGRLDRLRRAREDLSLVYPVQGPGEVVWWYFLEAGRPVLACPAPSSPEQARENLAALERIYVRKDHPALVASFEHVDSMLLACAWFRHHPRERRRCLTPEAAARRCQQWSAAV